MFLFSQLHFTELIAEISIFLGYKKVGTEHWVVCDASKSNKKCTKDVKDESHAERRTSKRKF